MNVLSFIKEAGQKFFKQGKESSEDSQTSLQSIRTYIESQGIDTKNLDISFDPIQDKIRVAGKVPDQETKEKILLCCGNVHGVGAVEDELIVETPGTQGESHYYTVKSGDTLAKIAKQFYGDEQKYPLIFEANRPMLSDPDKIYPGQTLRIPPQKPDSSHKEQLQ